MSSFLMIIVNLVKQNFAHFYQLVMAQLVIFVGGRHLEIAGDQICESMNLVILHDDIAEPSVLGDFFGAIGSA